MLARQWRPCGARGRDRDETFISLIKLFNIVGWRLHREVKYFSPNHVLVPRDRKKHNEQRELFVSISDAMDES